MQSCTDETECSCLVIDWERTFSILGHCAPSGLGKRTGYHHTARQQVKLLSRRPRSSKPETLLPRGALWVGIPRFPLDLLDSLRNVEESTL